MQDNLAPSAHSAAAASSTEPEPEAIQSDDDSEFVYDLYYRSDHPAVDPNTGLHSGGGGGADDVSSLAGLQRIGEL